MFAHKGPQDTHYKGSYLKSLRNFFPMDASLVKQDVGSNLTS